MLSVRKQRGVKITEINYIYDATGNRVHKTVDVYGSGFIQTGGKSINVVYWRDAQGNVLNTVTSGNEQQMPGEPSINKAASEFVIYGSSRLGTYSPEYQVYSLQFAGIAKNTLTLGYKAYELSNHLGNVLTTISDNYTITPPSGGGGLVRVLSSQDYYPFGMVMTERSFVEKQDRKYRYGFNTQETDEDIDEGGSHYTAEFWEYDGRTGRRWNVDPVVKVYISGYAVLGNSPIRMLDPSGNDWYEHKGDEKTGEGRSVVWKKGNGKTISVDGKTYDNIGATIKEIISEQTFRVWEQNKVVFEGYAFNQDDPSVVHRGNGDLSTEEKKGLATFVDVATDIMAFPFPQIGIAKGAYGLLTLTYNTKYGLNRAADADGDFTGKPSGSNPCLDLFGIHNQEDDVDDKFNGAAVVLPIVGAVLKPIATAKKMAKTQTAFQWLQDATGTTGILKTVDDAYLKLRDSWSDGKLMDALKKELNSSAALH